MILRHAAAGFLVALLVLSGCAEGGSGPSERAASTSTGDEPGAAVTVRRADLALSYTLDATTALGSSSDSGASSRAPEIDVVATLSPIQYLRYLSLPFTATAHVETVLGPTTVRCLALRSTPSAEATNDDAGSLRCRLPGHVETAPGLRSTLTIASKTIKDALLVPNLYIGHDDAADQYFVTTTQGGTERRISVQVGPSDGVVRVVQGDLQPGDELVRAGVGEP